MEQKRKGAPAAVADWAENQGAVCPPAPAEAAIDWAKSQGAICQPATPTASSAADWAKSQGAVCPPATPAAVPAPSPRGRRSQKRRKKA